MNPNSGYLCVETPTGDGRPDVPGTIYPIETCHAWINDAIETVSAWDIRRPAAPNDPFLVVRCNAVSSDALYVVYGDQAFLESYAASRDDCMPGREALRRGYDLPAGWASDGIDSGTVLGGSQEAIARQMTRAWRWWRCDVWEDPGGGPVLYTNVLRRLSAEGTLLPNLNTSPLPWDLDASGAEVPQASAVRRVVRLWRPALPWTLAGLGLHDLAETTEDREL